MQRGLSASCSAPRVFGRQPFEPIARSNGYFIVSPTASGPLIAAVAISGYCMERTPLTSSTVILLSGSGNLIPWNEKSRRIALACMTHLLLFFFFFVVVVVVVGNWAWRFRLLLGWRIEETQHWLRRWSGLVFLLRRRFRHLASYSTVPHRLLFLLE